MPGHSQNSDNATACKDHQADQPETCEQHKLSATSNLTLACRILPCCSRGNATVVVPESPLFVTNRCLSLQHLSLPMVCNPPPGCMSCSTAPTWGRVGASALSTVAVSSCSSLANSSIRTVTTAPGAVCCSKRLLSLMLVLQRTVCTCDNLRRPRSRPSRELAKAFEGLCFAGKTQAVLLSSSQVGPESMLIALPWQGPVRHRENTWSSIPARTPTS